MQKNKKMKMAIGGPSDVETREEYTARRIADTERGNLNRFEKVSPNPLYKSERDAAEGAKKLDLEMKIRKMRKENKSRKDPFANG